MGKGRNPTKRQGKGRKSGHVQRDRFFLEKTIRAMSWMIRRDKQSMRHIQGGFLPIEYISPHRAMITREASRDDIMTIVRGGSDNWKMRHPGKVGDKGRLWMSDTGRIPSRFKENEDGMPINDEDPSIGPGTERINHDVVTDLGLSRCCRLHIHMADVPNAERKEVSMTNMRKSANTLAKS